MIPKNGISWQRPSFLKIAKLFYKIIRVEKWESPKKLTNEENTHKQKKTLFFIDVDDDDDDD